MFWAPLQWGGHGSPFGGHCCFGRHCTGVNSALAYPRVDADECHPFDRMLKVPTFLFKLHLKNAWLRALNLQDDASDGPGTGAGVHSGDQLLPAAETVLQGSPILTRRHILWRVHLLIQGHPPLSRLTGLLPKVPNPARALRRARITRAFSNHHPISTHQRPSCDSNTSCRLGGRIAQFLNRAPLLLSPSPPHSY